MSVHDILSSEFMDALPEDDREAFSAIVRRGFTYLREQAEFINENESSSWNEYRGKEHSVMNVILSSARRLSIKPFDTMAVPLKSGFNDKDFEQFKSDIDHYMNDMLLDNTIQRRRDSVPVDQKSKDRIRSYIHSIRQQIDVAEMTEGKRAALLSRLAAFEKALEKGRLPVFEMTRGLLEILSLSCNVLALADSQTFHRLVNQTLLVMAEVKAVDDDQRQLPPSEPPTMYLPPRRPTEEREKKGGQRESYDLNDEIPF